MELSRIIPVLWIQQEQPNVELDRKAARLAEGFVQNAKLAGIPLKINRVGSSLFSEQEVVDYDTAKGSNMQLFKAYYVTMLEQAILTAPTHYEVSFVSAAHSDEDIERTISAHYQAQNKISNKG